MVWFGVLFYVVVYLQDVEVVILVLVKINLDGLFLYYLIGFVCVDSGIILLDDMVGKVFGFGDLNLILGYLILLVEILQGGYIMEVGVYFGDVVFIGGYEQIIVVVNNGDIDGGVIWVDGQGEWEDGFNLGVLCKVVDVGLIDMNDLVEIWCLKLILEGLVVLCISLLVDVQVIMVELVGNMIEIDVDCVYGIVVGEIVGFSVIDYLFYEIIVEVCCLKLN